MCSSDLTKKVVTVAGWLATLPAEKRKTAAAVIALVRKHVPKGYVEGFGWGVNWSVPLTILPDTYNKQPLAYVALLETKGGFSLHLMPLYWNKEREGAFRAAYKKAGKRLDMGMACVRFTTMDDLVAPAVKDVVKAIPMATYIANYRAVRAKTAKGR